MAIPLIVRIYRRADLSISFRPSGRPEAGHFQTASLAMLKDIAEHGRLPDFPPGWWVTVEGGKAVPEGVWFRSFTFASDASVSKSK